MYFSKMAENNLTGFSAPGTIMKLMIISKSKYGNGGHYCYLGWDIDRNILVRPIPSIGPDEVQMFWARNFQVNEVHSFQVICSHPNEIPLPHRNNDVHVNYLRREADLVPADVNTINQKLAATACDNIEDALKLGCYSTLKESYLGRQYVEEGENCQSCGIYKRQQVDGRVELVLFELARPLSGEQGFSPRRCFLMEILQLNA